MNKTFLIIAQNSLERCPQGLRAVCKQHFRQNLLSANSIF